MASPASPIISDDDQDIALISNEMSASTPSNSVVSNSSARSDSPLRKRARYDSTSQEQNIIDERMQRMPRDTVRDDTYYLVDGSCVLLVDDTLFNVRVTSWLHIFCLFHLTSMIGIRRCIEQSFPKIVLSSAGCLLSPRAIIPLKEPLTLPSF